MTPVAFADAVAELPPRVQDRLAGPLSAVSLAGTEPVAFAGYARRQGERGLLVLTDRELVFAPETGRVDRTPLDRLDRAVPSDAVLMVAPGEGGRLQDDFRPLKPETFAGVEWPAALLAVQPGARPRDADGGAGRIVALVLALLVVAAIVAGVVLLVA